jgi:hypothetical protein
MNNHKYTIIPAAPNTIWRGKEGDLFNGFLVVAWSCASPEDGIRPAQPVFAPKLMGVGQLVAATVAKTIAPPFPPAAFAVAPAPKAVLPPPPPPPMTFRPVALSNPTLIDDWAVPPFTVIKATVSENAQRYLNITVAGGTARRKLYLRFYLGATTEPRKTAWNNCLAAFLIRLGVPKLSDTDQLLGKTVVLCIDHFRTALQSVESINEAMCMEDA